jgi:anti-sigma regulatory factor (Ser/Thr protein kinase)
MTGELLPPTAGLSIRANPSDVAQASMWLERECHQRGVPAGQIVRLDLCLNEALANVILHGGEKALQAPVQLELTVEKSSTRHHAILTVVDFGAAFYPEAYQLKPSPSSLVDAEPGGLGVRMMRSFSDGLDYLRHDQMNELKIMVHWAPSE